MNDFAWHALRFRQDNQYENVHHHRGERQPRRACLHRHSAAIRIQLDLLGSWKPADAHEVTLLASVGSSRVSVGSITATDTQGGCLYDIVFGPTALTGW